MRHSPGLRAAMRTTAGVMRTVQKVHAEWNIVHIGVRGRLFTKRSQPRKLLRSSDLEIAARMAMQVQTCL